MTPRSIRLPDGSTAKGYLREQFADAWERYCPPEDTPAEPPQTPDTPVPPADRHNGTTLSGTGISGDSRTAQAPPCAGQENDEIPHGNGVVPVCRSEWGDKGNGGVAAPAAAANGRPAEEGCGGCGMEIGEPGRGRKVCPTGGHCPGGGYGREVLASGEGWSVEIERGSSDPGWSR